MSWKNVVVKQISLHRIRKEDVAVPSAELNIEKNPRAARGLTTQDKLFVTPLSARNIL